MSRSFIQHGKKYKKRGTHLELILVCFQPRELFFETFDKVNNILMSAADAIGLARDRLGIGSWDNHGARVDLDGVPELLVWSNFEGVDCGTGDGRSQLGAGV